MLKRILSKDITSLCNINGITEQGNILIENDVIEVYKVDPINIVSYDMEAKRNIYNLYLSTIRGLPSDFQIVIVKEKDSLKHEIELYKNRLLVVENYGLKLAMKKYVEYLEEMEANNTIYTTKHYLVVKAGNDNNIVEVFSNLNELGLSITKIKSKKDIEKILRKAIQ